MQNSGGEDRKFDEVSDDEIKKMLVSSELPTRQLGLVYLDAKMRYGICGKIEKKYKGRLSDGDIGRIWEATLDSITKNVEECKFDETGGLKGYVKRIAYRRAADFLPKRIPINESVDVDTFMPRRCDPPHELPDLINREAIRRCYKKLPKKERRVIDHDVRLFLEILDKTDCEKWPSPDELLAAVNADGEHSLTLDAVRSARARSRRKLREAAQEKEH